MNKNIKKTIDVRCRGGIQEYIGGTSYDVSLDTLVPVANPKIIAAVMNRKMVTTSSFINYVTRET